MSFDYKKHYNWPGYDEGNDGTGNKKLSEPVPAYPKRTGDLLITGAGIKETGNNNNAQILIGRDRAPFWVRPDGKFENPSKENWKTNQVSGFSDHMRAGAIDIVVGRGMPHPVSDWDDQGQQPVLPLYTWTPSGKTGTRVTNQIIDETGELINHGGQMCDAARIYISQMCHIDEYFNIQDDEYSPDTFDQKPSSAIMLKADKLRMHSRRNIKLVAGGDMQEGQIGFGVDSHNNRIKTAGGVHLISGNGSSESEEMQPLVKGENLILCLKEIISVIQDMASIVYSNDSEQMRTNVTQGNHIHGTAGGCTPPDPLTKIQTQCDIFSKVNNIMQTCNAKMHNITSIENTYLNRGTTAGPKKKRWICSTYHTLN